MHMDDRAGSALLGRQRGFCIMTKVLHGVDAGGWTLQSLSWQQRSTPWMWSGHGQQQIHPSGKAA